MDTPFPYGLVSADSHVTEPPDCYSRFIDPAYRDRAPYIRRDDKRGDLYVIPGMEHNAVAMGLVAAAGEESSQMTFTGRDFEDWHRSGWDPTHRLADQDRDGVVAEMLFATVGMNIAGHDDLDYRQATMEAYNRWLQEYCDHAPDRLYGAGQAAMQTPAGGAAELRAIADQGFHAVMMAGVPGNGDYDDPVWDPVWATAIEHDLPLCFHILTDTSFRPFRGPKINALLNTIRSCQDIVGMFIYSGVFDRFPELRIVCVEADAGWAPHYAHRMDAIYDRHRFWNRCQELQRKPSEYFHDNVYMTFQDDPTAFRCHDQLNAERLLWANDFPHSDSTWPLSQQLLVEHTSHLGDEVRRRILRDNAVELFGMDPPEIASTVAAA